MGRADIRRSGKEKKEKTPTYNFTKEQLDGFLAKAKQEATDEAVNTALVLLLTLPLEVLMDHYWPKTYAKKIPEFTDYVLEYYEKWENGELDMDELREDLWKYGGVRLEAERADIV